MLSATAEADTFTLLTNLLLEKAIKWLGRDITHIKVMYIVCWLLKVMEYIKQLTCFKVMRYNKCNI